MNNLKHKISLLEIDLQAVIEIYTQQVSKEEINGNKYIVMTPGVYDWIEVKLKDIKEEIIKLSK